jgi:hypothetical protein
MQIDYTKAILLSITGKTSGDWGAKLKEINELGITEVAVFLSSFDKKERDNFYRLLLKSTVKKIPFVHLRDDVTAEEIKFFIEKFGTEYFNIHEHDFKTLDNWKDYKQKLYLEMDFNDKIEKDVIVKKIGGFCVDLSHYKASVARGTEEASYVYAKKNDIIIACNHLNGYSEERTEDIHAITNLKEFDYLTSLPKYIFGEVIALEVYNSIKEQINFREYAGGIINTYLRS